MGQSGLATVVVWLGVSVGFAIKMFTAAVIKQVYQKAWVCLKGQLLKWFTWGGACWKEASVLLYPRLPSGFLDMAVGLVILKSKMEATRPSPTWSKKPPTAMSARFCLEGSSVKEFVDLF